MTDLPNNMLSQNILGVQSKILDEGEDLENPLIDVLQVLSSEGCRKILQDCILLFKVELVFH